MKTEEPCTSKKIDQSTRKKFDEYFDFDINNMSTVHENIQTFNEHPEMLNYAPNKPYRGERENYGNDYYRQHNRDHIQFPKFKLQSFDESNADSYFRIAESQFSANQIYNQKTKYLYLMAALSIEQSSQVLMYLSDKCVDQNCYMIIFKKG